MILSWIFALLSIVMQSHDVPVAFTHTILRCDHAIISAEFIGCKSVAIDGEVWYAGYSQGAWVTGP